MYYLIYKITNIINGKFYIGAHQTLNKDDGYMGSGILIKRSIKKHGIKNFKKEILFECTSKEDMFQKEKLLVTLCNESYNLKQGGEGGFDYINSSGKNIYDGHSSKAKENLKLGNAKFKELMMDPDFNSSFRKKVSDSTKGLQNFLGKLHKEESKQKIGAKSSVHQKGSGNSQFGSRWIYNLELKISKKIKKDDPLPENWFEGRKLKF